MGPGQIQGRSRSGSDEVLNGSQSGLGWVLVSLGGVLSSSQVGPRQVLCGVFVKSSVGLSQVPAGPNQVLGRS